MTDFAAFLDSVRTDVDAALDRVLPAESAVPSRLHEAMRYAVFAGGKRFRPALLVSTGERLGVPREDLLKPAAALELIHTFSLVHDDLPALDDDDLRRGRPTVHVAYDEALAVLVGDALLGLGLEVLTHFPVAQPAEARNRATAAAAAALGSRGMIGGQVDDLQAEGNPEVHSAELLESIHRRKTGELIVLSVRIPGFYAGLSEGEDELLTRFGELLGLMFQMVDDILDVEGDTETLGKTAGKDMQVAKLTYPRLFGLDETRKKVRAAEEEALGIARTLPGDSSAHAALVEFLVHRQR
ncbi:MAG: polyprenyl synthetase family protein [Acidobacteriota bacterium]